MRVSGITTKGIYNKDASDVTKVGPFIVSNFVTSQLECYCGYR